jgi:hypothetical protein
MIDQSLLQTFPKRCATAGASLPTVAIATKERRVLQTLSNLDTARDQSSRWQTLAFRDVATLSFPQCDAHHTRQLIAELPYLAHHLSSAKEGKTWGGQAPGTRIDRFSPDRLLLRMAVFSTVLGRICRVRRTHWMIRPTLTRSLVLGVLALVSTTAIQPDVRVEALVTG